MYKREQGFTLAEIGVVIVIVGLIAGIVFGAITVQMQNARVARTNANLDGAKAALQRFVAKNGRLPCPARVNAVAANADFGQEATGLPLNTNNPCQNANIGTSAAGGALFRVYRGLLPWRALGLSEDQATDGWDHYLSYFVSATAIRNPTNGALPAGSGLRGALNVNDQAGATLQTGLPAVIVSHGANGWGGYVFGNLPNRVNATGGSALEDNNADNNLTVISAPYADSGTNQFDDVLRWLTVDEALAEASKSAGGFQLGAQEARIRANNLMITMARITAINRTGTAPNWVYTLPVANGAATPYTFATPPFAGAGCLSTANPPTPAAAFRTWNAADANTLQVPLSSMEDPWGTRFRMFRGSNTVPSTCSNVLAFVSAGPDASFGTADDLMFTFTSPAVLAQINRFL